MKSGNLNFLEHSGPLQARNGTALPIMCHVLVRTNSTVFSDAALDKWFL